MGIICMRKISIALFFLLSCSLLYPSVSLSTGDGMIASDNASFSFRTGRTYIDLGLLSYGEIGSSGLLRTMDSPHSTVPEFIPEVIRPGRNDGRNGFVFSSRDFHAVFSTDERPVVGIAFSSPYLTLGFLHADGVKQDESFHDDKGRGISFDTEYWGIGFSWRFLNISFMLSFAEEIGFRGVASIFLEKDDYSLSLSYGSLIALYADSPDSTFGIKGSFGENGYLFVFSIGYGAIPVFSDEYLSSESYTASRFDIGGVRIIAESESSFTSNGKRTHSERFSFLYSMLSLGYDTDEGLFVAIDFGHFAIGYRDRMPFVEMEQEIRKDGFSILAGVSTDEGISIGVRCYL